MPYRRLPTTDKARIRALNAAIKLAENGNAEKELAFSKGTLVELKQVKTTFESTLQTYNAEVKKQSEKNKDYKDLMGKAALYISHFIQVLYMAIEREEIKEDVLSFYELDSFAGKIPSLNSEEELLKWGAKIIDGEQKRIQKGGNPIYSPSIALVKVRFETFKDSAIFMQNMHAITNRYFERMKVIRISTNNFICKLWNEIEESIRNETPKHKSKIAQDYGIVYILRRKEKKKLITGNLQPMCYSIW